MNLFYTKTYFIQNNNNWSNHA